MPKTVLLLLFTLVVACAMAQNRYDVVITEIMADPSPQVGLPSNKWLELKNVSPTAINLQNWRLADAGSITGPMPSFVLQPDSFVIVCTSSAVAAMSAYGKTISVTSFLSLRLAGDRIVLQNAQGKTIHAVEYNLSWYQNVIKADGGWTLEMIDTKNPCGGATNWKASIDASGGTPGRKNSVDGNNTDLIPPQLVRSFTIDSLNILAVFNEPLDSTTASMASKYQVNGNTVVTATAQAPLFSTVQLRLSTPLQKKNVYTLKVSDVSDCKGNVMASSSQVKTGFPEDALPDDVVINEILFNPKPNANDFIEVYNKSSKVLDAAKILIANRNSSGAISSFKNFSDIPYLIFPEEYIVLTSDLSSLQSAYFVQQPQNVLTVALPSYPNDKGTVVVTNQQGDIVDEVNYSEKWHFQLITNRQGVSLERINPLAASQDANNWTSAASTVGYATPTYKNSQQKLSVGINGMVEVTPKTFSPDNDGFDDIATIAYQVSEPGYVANVTIFDAAGRPVRYLVRNGLLGYMGSWNWNGLGEKQEKLPIGTYVVFTELFTLDGKRQQFKNAVVLARRLN